MKPPKLVYVGPTDYIVKTVGQLDLLGETQCNESLILLRRKQSKSALRGTLIHEIIHAIIFEAGLNKVLDLDHDKEEMLVATIAPWILAVIQDNPKLVGFLLRDTEEEAA